MEIKFGLTPTEMEIMEYLWKENRNFSFKELLSYFKSIGKEWKGQTLSTYLAQLQKKGLVLTAPNGKVRLFYYPAYTKEEHISKWMGEVLANVFDHSVSRMVMAATGGEQISSEEAERLKKLF